MVGQDRALKIAGWENPAGFSGGQRERLNQEKIKTRQRQGWERSRGKGQERERQLKERREAQIQW